MEPLPSNGRCTAAHLAVAAQQRVYMSQYVCITEVLVWVLRVFFAFNITTGIAVYFHKEDNIY
jgi:hypothetical protein